MIISRAKYLSLGVGAAVLLGIWLVSGGPAQQPDTPNSYLAPGSDSATVEVIAETGGSDGFSHAVAVRDTLAVFSRGRKLVIVDVSDPSSPVVAGSIILPGEIRDVVLSDRHAFAAADSAGLQIIDLSDPARPTRLSAIEFEDRVDGVTVDGSHAYVAARSQGLRIVDISTPSDPVEVSHVITPDEAVDVVVRDGYAYVSAWYESMRVIDVRDVDAPEEVSFASYDSYDNGAAWSVYVEGDIGLNTIPEMGLRTVDISNPHDVKLYKVYRGLFAPAGVAARGKIAFVADQDAGFRVLDLTTPARLVEIGSLDLPGSPLAVVLNGDHAYVAAREGGLRIIDVSRPNAPVETAYVDDDDTIVDVSFGGDGLYAAGIENSAYIFNENTPLEPVGVGPSRRVVLDGSRILAAGEDGVWLNDLTGRAQPVHLLTKPANGVALEGDLIVSASGIDGLQILNAGRPVGEYVPQRLGVEPLNREQLLRTAVSAWDVILQDDMAFGAFDDGIRIVDLSTPSAPTLVGAIPTPQRVYRVAFADSMLLAACDDGLRIFDPSTHKELAYIKTPSFATALAVNDNRVYIGDLSGSLTVMALNGRSKTGTDRPVVTGVYEVAHRVHGLALANGKLAVAAGTQGVRIVRIEEPPL